MKVIKIVLTGGPCAGKTTILNSIKKYLDEKKIFNLIIPETATELILSGIKPPTNIDEAFPFQELVLKKQISKEEIADSYAYLQNKDLCVIVYDRGVIDNKAYLRGQNEFDNLLSKHNLDEISLVDNYDLVLDLITTAKCKKEAYGNNEYRYESLEEAINVDEKTTNAWLLHRNLKIVNSNISLEEEENIVLKYVDSIINSSEIRVIDKYPINEEKSDFSKYNDSNSKLIEVEEFRLKVKENKDYKYIIKKRKYKNKISYNLCVKKVISSFERIIVDEIIDKDKFIELINTYDIIEKIIKKELTFVSNLQLYKVCFYGDLAVLEVEENTLNDELIIPDEIKLLNGNKVLKK